MTYWYLDDRPVSLHGLVRGPYYWMIRVEDDNRIVAYVSEKDDAEEMVRLHNAKT